MDQRVKPKLSQGETRRMQIEKGFGQECCSSYSEYLTKEALEGFGDFKTRGQVTRTVKYADDLVLLVKEEAMLQGMFECLNCNWKVLWNGNEGGKT